MPDDDFMELGESPPRFTVSTDPDGRSYLFGRNHPEPDSEYMTGGTELFGWSDEALEALRRALRGEKE